MKSPYLNPDIYLERRALPAIAANDAGDQLRDRIAIREDTVRRFAALVGGATMTLCLLAMGALIVALWFGAAQAAWLFLGAMVTSAVTAIAASVLEARFGG